MRSYLSLTCNALLLLSLVSCLGGKATESVSSGDSSTGSSLTSLRGVAATGAPIVSGQVFVKDSQGNSPKESVFTKSDGSYSVKIEGLEKPLLVKVVAPSGEKFISVATESALVQGLKVNLTPLSHIIVSNVLQEADPDVAFSSFNDLILGLKDESIEERVKKEKSSLVEKFKSAGLIGDDGLLSGEIDLLNGDFVPGTSKGIDGLLDVIDVKKIDGNFEIRMKGNADAFIYDNISSDDKIDQTKIDLSSAKETISAIDEIRAMMLNLSKTYSSYANCSGAPELKNPDSPCYFKKIIESMKVFFHPEFMEDGQKSYFSWLCQNGANSIDSCKELEFSTVQLKDITLLDYEGKKARISFNVYESGIMRGSEEFILARDGSDEGKFKLYGNRKSFRYWIETSSQQNTEVAIDESGKLVPSDSYKVKLNFYLENGEIDNLVNGREFKLYNPSGKPLFNGATAIPLYVVTAPNWDNGVCESSLALSTTNSPYSSWDSITGDVIHKSFEEACGKEADPCKCANGYFDHERSSSISLDEKGIAVMDNSEKLILTDGMINDEFSIRKPLIVNEYNSDLYIPQLDVIQFCSESSPYAQVSAQVASGVLEHSSLHISGRVGESWEQMSSSSDLWEGDDASSSAIIGIDPDEVAQKGFLAEYKNLWLSSVDQFNRQFVRSVSCPVVPVMDESVKSISDKLSSK